MFEHSDDPFRISSLFDNLNIPYDLFTTNVHDLQMHLDTLSVMRAVDPQGELSMFATMMSLKRGSRR